MGSHTTSKSKDKSSSEGIVKHRACDECRSRKLACSKEHEGCTRCRREGVRCVYSPQKPMGRPRKRRAADGSLTPGGSTPEVTLETDFSFIDAGEQSYEFLDLLSPSYALPLVNSGAADDHHQYGGSAFDGSMHNHAYSGHHGHHYAHSSSSSSGHHHFAFGADVLGRIDFADTDSQSADEEVSSYYNDGLSRYMAAQVPQGPSSSLAPPMAAPTTSESQASSSSASSSSEPSSSASPRPYHNTACRCLSSMYLAMDALAGVPADGVAAAMKAARGACRVAHDVVHCPACSLPMLRDPTAAPPVQSFQNTMLLGALIPTVANAYAHILRLVDTEAAAAERDRRTIHFTFKEFGGLWGRLRDEEGSCGVVGRYDMRDLEPATWRLTVRALLKVDIYGHTFEKAVPADAAAGSDTNGTESDTNTATTTGKKKQVRHLGLKDVVDELDERSRLRHEKVDELVASGKLSPDMYPNVLPVPHNPDQIRQRNCFHIIHLARGAVDRLVIP